MALIHDAKKEIHAKIVYFGPARSGKTTNLEFVYNKLKPEYRGTFKFMNTPHGRMVFFDFMRPELAGIKDYSLHFHLYTIPGDAENAALWKNVLKGVDGIVFVADLDPSRAMENVRSFECLQQYLASHDMRFDEIPCILQCNKKDVPGALALEDVHTVLGMPHAKLLAASARSGEGVLSSLSEMVKMVIQKLRDVSIESESEPMESAALVESAEEQVTAQEMVQRSPETEPATDDHAAYFPETMRFPVVAEERCSLSPEAFASSLDEVDGAAGSASELENEVICPQDVLHSTANEFTEPAPLPMDESEPDLAEPGDEPLAVTVQPTVSLSAQTAESELPAEEELTVSLEHDLEADGTGLYRQTIVVRYAGREKRFALALSLSIN
jgi:uncharacterized protein